MIWRHKLLVPFYTVELIILFYTCWLVTKIKIGFNSGLNRVIIILLKTYVVIKIESKQQNSNFDW